MADIEKWRSVVRDATALSPEEQETDAFRSVDLNALRSGFSPEPTSYFSDYVADGPEQYGYPASEDATKMPSWPPEDPFPKLSPESLMDTVQPRLLSHPQRPLEIGYIPMLGCIFEGYRNLLEEKEKVEHLLKEETARFLTLENKYENEIHWLKVGKKELEMLVAQGDGGVATMRLARENRALRRRTQNLFDDGEDDEEDDEDDTHKEGDRDTEQEEVTAQEFLERSRRSEDESWADHKAAYGRSLSPSFQMQLLSKKLSEDDAPIPELPDGTVPMRGPSTLAQASLLQRQFENGDSHDAARVVLPPDFQADEPSRLLAARAMAKKSMLNLKEHLTASGTKPHSEDEDVKAIKRMAKSLSKRRGLNLDVVLPKLLDVFSINGETDRKGDTPVVDHCAPATIGTGQCTRTSHIPATAAKAPGLKARASGLLQKLKPQLSREALATPTTPQNHVSFECGDDGVNKTALHKSYLLQAPEVSTKARKHDDPDKHSQRDIEPMAPLLSQATFSPTAPVSGGARKPTRIPTPTYNTGTFAQPRREREDSLSSVLTALKRPTTSPLHQDGTQSELTGSPLSSGAGGDLSPSPLAHKRRQARRSSLVDRTNSLAYRTDAGRGQDLGDKRSQSLHMATMQGVAETSTGNRGNIQCGTHFPSLVFHYREATSGEDKSPTAGELGFTG
ncbi:hypothetical protein K431DRAFT_325531 [Polychaeton citri CBS 116435]|uniref:Uncharacterized protein n=1 Tax=Polychaeton citri CBS 116435 TaxID=1314669 RepID=A0A9P4QC54_9PEZI|nr:hypothetical protein K431DRAFT_325531 [Polychaeton citri CBS 116435]